MAQSGSLSVSGYSLVLAFHRMDRVGGGAAAATSVKARFPDPAKLFMDLRTARATKAVSASYLKRAAAADAPITYPNLGITLGYADAGGLKRIKSHPGIAAAYPAPLLQHIRPVRSLPQSSPRNIRGASSVSRRGRRLGPYGGLQRQPALQAQGRSGQA